jgi:predicted nucleotidyltransferase
MYRDPDLVGRHQDIQEVAVYGSFVSGKETPRDIDVIIHSHSPISLPDQVRWKLMDYAEAHDIDIIYMTSETLYWRYLEFAADRYGKVVRMRF